MIKRLYILLFAVVSLSVSLFAQEKLSAYSQMVLNRYQTSAESRQTDSKLNKITVFSTDNNDKARVKVIISLNEGCEFPTETFSALDVETINEFGTSLTAWIPIDNLEKLAEIDEIASVSVARKMRPLNDKARAATKVDEAHLGTDLSGAFTGKDVVVGIVDVGLDYNHINFKDSDGNSRVKVAGKYNPNTGNTLIYNSASTIAKLTTDDETYSHGTHVAGIATGSYTTNNYYGMAPASDIVLYGLGEDMSDANILDGVKAVFDYAETVGKPAVVNLSLGGNAGPHDGSDEFCKSLDELIDDGKIVLLAAGNEGGDGIHINNVFSQSSTTTPQFATLIDYYDLTYDCEVDAWSRGSEPFGIQFFIYNTFSKTEVLTSSIFYPTTTSSKQFTWSDSNLSTYFSGKIYAVGALRSANNCYQLYVSLDGDVTKSNYRIGVKYYGTQGTEINCWANLSEFINLDNSNYTKGSADMSFNNMGCGVDAITIGAYSAKREFSTYEGYVYYYSDATVNDIAPFSSYGTDFNGVNHPTITAPGYTVVSSVNGFDETTVTYDKAYLCDIVSVSGDTRKYHWGDMAGTSMATPVATGTVALWLQADPELSPAEVRSIMKETATTDSYTASGNPIQWGAGKLNAQAGLIKILKGNNSAITDVIANENPVLLFPNPTDGRFTVYAYGDSRYINISIYGMNGAMLYNEKKLTDNGTVDIDLNGTLAKGIYLLNVQGENINHTTRLIIK